MSSYKRFNSYEIFYDRTRQRWLFNRGDPMGRFDCNCSLFIIPILTSCLYPMKRFFFQKLETLLNLNNTWIIIQWSFVNRKSKIDTIEEQSLEKKIWNNWTIKKTYWNCAIISELITCDTSALYVKTLKTIITVIVFIGNVIMYVTPVWLIIISIGVSYLHSKYSMVRSKEKCPNYL